MSRRPPHEPDDRRGRPTVRSSRVIATSLVLAAGGIVAAIGVTWAADAPVPRLERTSSAVLFDDVHLTPGVPVERCAGIVPRGAGLIGVGFDGGATGSLSAAARLRVERGSGRADGAGGCNGFVPVTTVYDGTLADLPAPGSVATVPVTIDADQPVAYRATLSLPSPAAGHTRFGLRITGLFADAPSGPAPPVPPPGPTPGDDTPPPPCLQLQSGHRIERTSGDGAVRVTVRTPRALPVQLVRPLPVYVTTRGSTARPRMTAGGYRVRLRRTIGGRWVGHVPAAALRRTPRVTVTVGRGSVTVPLRTRPCAARVRAFLRSGDMVDLRVDTRRSLAGLRVRIPAVLGRPSGGVLRIGAVDARGVPHAARGRVTVRGRAATSRLPRVVLAGRRIEVLDVPAGVRTLSLRLTVPGAAAARRTVCRRDRPVTGGVAVQGPDGLIHDAVRSPLRPIGDRCPAGG